MGGTLIEALRPHPAILLIAVAVDLAIGDPVYPLHPVRIIGLKLSAIETRLRRIGADGYGGGIALLVALAAIVVGAVSVIVWALTRENQMLGWIAHGFFVYSFLALGDLIRHVWRVERALTSGDLDGARSRITALVGRDVERMDAAACRRAAIESLSENLTDGFTSPLMWYLVGGLPGLTTFKIVSTMDSMVGYKTERYLKFGWCGARLDDVMNYVPAARHVAADRRGRRPPAVLFRPKSIPCRSGAARDSAWPQFGMERNGDGRRHSATARRADLDARLARDRRVDWRPSRSTCGRA